MSEISSARPDRLQSHRRRVEPIDEDLAQLAREFDATLSEFAAGAGEFAPGFDPLEPGQIVRGIHDESEHLSEWVVSVGNAFADADSGTRVVTVADSFLAQRVGQPTLGRAGQARDGRAAAAELKGALEAAGIDPTDFDPSQLGDLHGLARSDDAAYVELFETIERIGGRMDDEAFAVAFFDQMNPDGIRATLGVIDMFALIHRERSGDEPIDVGRLRETALDDGTVADRLLDPFVNGFALASRSLDLAEEPAALLDVGANGDVHTARWQQRQLALLISGGPELYDPDFLAAAAGQILTHPELNRFSSIEAMLNDYPALGGSPSRWGAPERAFNDAIAMSALAGNADAAFSYLAIEDPTERHVRISTLLHPPDGVARFDPDMHQYDPHWGGDWEHADQLEASYRQNGADALERGLVDALAIDPARYDAGLDIYADVVRVVGDRGVTGPTATSTAKVFITYAPGIGESAHDQMHREHGDADPATLDFNRPDIIDFFAALAPDETAASLVGVGILALAYDGTAPFYRSNPDRVDVENSMESAGLLLGAVEVGFAQSGSESAAASNSFERGVQLFSGIALSQGLARASMVAGPPTAVGFSLVGPLVKEAVNQVIDGRIEPDPPPFEPGQMQLTVTSLLTDQIAVGLEEYSGVDRGDLNSGEYVGRVLADVHELDGLRPSALMSSTSTDQRTFGPNLHWHGGYLVEPH